MSFFRSGVALLVGLMWFGTALSAPLHGSEWTPLLIGETAIPQASSIFVQFRGEGRLQGYGGCNRLFAEYMENDGCISIGTVAGTRMACDELVMQREAALIGALEKTRSYRRMRTRLMLFDEDRVPLMELRQTDWD